MAWARLEGPRSEAAERRELRVCREGDFLEVEAAEGAKK